MSDYPRPSPVVGPAQDWEEKTGRDLSPHGSTQAVSQYRHNFPVWSGIVRVAGYSDGKCLAAERFHILGIFRVYLELFLPIKVVLMGY